MPAYKIPIEIVREDLELTRQPRPTFVERHLRIICVSCPLLKDCDPQIRVNRRIGITEGRHAGTPNCHQTLDHPIGTERQKITFLINHLTGALKSVDDQEISIRLKKLFDEVRERRKNKPARRPKRSSER